MDRKSKIFFFVFFLFIVGSIGVTYYRIFVQRDYIIRAEAACDPYTENCFVYTCDVDTEECTGDPKEDTSYYKIINRNAKNIPSCDPAEEGCEALVCPTGEVGCTYTLCDERAAGTDAICNDPLVYTAENPIEEDTAEDVSDGAAGEETQDMPSDTIQEGNNNDEGEEPAHSGEIIPLN